MMSIFFQFRSISIFIFLWINLVWSGTIQITNENLNEILSSNEIVFLNFYANWCRFSQILNPIYEQLANRVSKEYPGKGRIIIGKVDCDAQGSIAEKHHVNKYPTLKLYRYGLVTKREYRGARTVDSLFEYLQKELQSSVIQLLSSNDLLGLDQDKGYIIARSNDQIFSKTANLLRDQCHFVIFNNSNSTEETDLIFYRSPKSSNLEDQFYNGLRNDSQSLYMWSHEKCIPLVRQITFLNAEELTDEGLPFLILFHSMDDYQSLHLFEKEISKELLHQRSTINCLHADGKKFLHPLKHLGKTIEDLPVLVIDTFKHMFLFPDFKQISEKGKLLQFVKDLHSEKLHQQFHNSVQKDIHSSSRESIFVRLSPSRQRYSFRDEL